MRAPASAPADALPTHLPGIQHNTVTNFQGLDSASGRPFSTDLVYSHCVAAAKPRARRLWRPPPLAGKCSFSVSTVPGTCGCATLPSSTSRPCEFTAQGFRVQLLAGLLCNGSSQIRIDTLWHSFALHSGETRPNVVCLPHQNGLQQSAQSAGNSFH